MIDGIKEKYDAMTSQQTRDAVLSTATGVASAALIYSCSDNTRAILGLFSGFVAGAAVGAEIIHRASPSKPINPDHILPVLTAALGALAGSYVPYTACVTAFGLTAYGMYQALQKRSPKIANPEFAALNKMPLRSGFVKHA